MQEEKYTYKKAVVLLIAIATLVRLFFAMQIELGIDEVYYWNFVLFPQWSYFDHPMMIGWVGQIFSLHHLVRNEFVLRLGPIVLSAICTWIIFLVAKKVKDEKAGWYAALLFTGSIYCSIIAGFSFIPDAPLVLFILISLYLLVDILPAEELTSPIRRKMILFGVMAGLAMLSKYQGAFLWVGVFCYVLIYNRKWLKDFSFYLAGLLSGILLLPILIWNLQNDFISFNYHSERVTPSWDFRADYFFTEVFGQVAYNNPIVYVLVLLAVIAWFRKSDFIEKKWARILVTQAIPLWAVFTSFSIFRSTLPHWSAPAFIPLIILASAFWSASPRHELALKWIKGSCYFLAFLLVTAYWLINYSPLQLGKKSDVANFGEDDFTQDLYGWNQVERGFAKIAEREETQGTMPHNADLLCAKMFPAAHLDFYVAQPHDRKMFAIGPLNEIHMYAWIDQWRGGLESGKDYYHVALSNFYMNPDELFGNYFEKIEPIDTVEIKRADKIMRYAFFYRLKNYKGNFTNLPHGQ